MKKNYFALALIALMLLGSSCRSRQNAHRQASETTVQRKILSSAPPATTARGATSRPVVEVSVRQPVATASQTPIEVSDVQERGNVLLTTDASALRRYSVVVASLSTRWNAESLQTRLQNEGHTVILSQNEHGMFRVIVGSFDDRASAVMQREQLRRRYSALGSPDFLRRKYGISFDDLWILVRED